MGVIARMRRASWRSSSALGDLDAAMRGPGPYARRLARKSVYRHVGRSTRWLLRKAGL